MDIPTSLNAQEVQHGIQKYELENITKHIKKLSDRDDVQKAIEQIFIFFLCGGHGKKLYGKVAFYNYESRERLKEEYRKHIEMLTEYMERKNCLICSFFHVVYETMQNHEDSMEDLENLYRALYALFKDNRLNQLPQSWAKKMTGNSGFLRRLKKLLPFFELKVCNINVAQHKQKEEVFSLLQRLQGEDLKEKREEVDDGRLATWYQENNAEEAKVKSYAYMFRLADETENPLEVEDENHNIGGRMLDDIEDGKLGYWCRRQYEIVKRKTYELKHGT